MTPEERLYRDIISYGDKYKDASEKEKKIENIIQSLINKTRDPNFLGAGFHERGEIATLQGDLFRVQQEKKQYFDAVQTTQKQLADLEIRNTGQNESAPAAPAAPAAQLAAPPAPRPQEEAPSKPIEDFNSAVAAAKEEAQQKITQARQQTATSKEDHLARQQAHAMEREAKKEVNQAAGTRAATEGRDVSKAMREIAGMGRPPAVQASSSASTDSEIGRLRNLDSKILRANEQYRFAEAEGNKIVQKINDFQRVFDSGTLSNLSAYQKGQIAQLQDELKINQKIKNDFLSDMQHLERQRSILTNKNQTTPESVAAPAAQRPSVQSSTIPDVEAM
jgi:hypothetical protein